MAGPGGGSRGGGFGGGSFSGGSRGGSSGGRGFSGGSFGGNFGGHHNGGHFGGGFHGHHHGHRHHRGPVFRYGYHRPYHGGYVRGGGGCFSVVFILFFLVVVAGIFFSNLTFRKVDVSYNEYVMYDEATFQDYANDSYNELFGSSSARGDNILIVFLANDEADGYYTIAWVGDNVAYEINEMFGEYSDYGYAMSNRINQTYYGYSLDTDYARVISYMTDCVSRLGLESSFIKASDKSNMIASCCVNRTALELDETVVNEALEGFTDETGIPCILLVDRVQNVFGEYGQENEGSVLNIGEIFKTGSIITLAVPAFMFLAGVIILVLILKGRKKHTAAEQRTENNNKNAADAGSVSCGSAQGGESGRGAKTSSDEKPPWELD